jgi:1D-myo-inositol-tetrakisphosphate 5-kinase/inositol-polyphosphate multikinase
MIDFAHTGLAEGEGPDEGVLRGLGTLRGLVRARREEVGRWIEQRGEAPEATI